MSYVDNLRKIPTPMICLHIFSKVMIGFGLGVVFAKSMRGYGVWIIVAGIVLSIPPLYKIITGK